MLMCPLSTPSCVKAEDFLLFSILFSAMSPALVERLVGAQ